jgi:hypothetical protein
MTIVIDSIISNVPLRIIRLIAIKCGMSKMDNHVCQWKHHWDDAWRSSHSCITVMSSFWSISFRALWLWIICDPGAQFSRLLQSLTWRSLLFVSPALRFSSFLLSEQSYHYDCHDTLHVHEIVSSAWLRCTNDKSPPTWHTLELFNRPRLSASVNTRDNIVAIFA